MGVQQLEEAWAVRAGAREARLACGPACAGGAVVCWGLYVPAIVWLRLPMTLPMRLRAALMVAMSRWWAHRLLMRLLPRPRVLMLRLMPRGRTCGGLSTPSVGLVCAYPIFVRLGRAAREARALLVVDNTVASAFGCDPLRLGAALSLEALDRVCAGEAPRKLVAASVARSQLKRHRVDAAAECVHALLVGCDAPALDLSVEEADVLEHGLNSLDARMQAHFDRARALAEYSGCERDGA